MNTNEFGKRNPFEAATLKLIENLHPFFSRSGDPTQDVRFKNLICASSEIIVGRDGAFHKRKGCDRADAYKF